nr:hypothetical protein [Bacillus atrophaeus]
MCAKLLFRRRRLPMRLLHFEDDDRPQGAVSGKS